MKTTKLSRRKLAEYRCADNSVSMQLIDLTLVTRVIKELMKLLQSEVNYDYELVDEAAEMIKEELGSWFMEEYPLYVGS
ncbi:MAG: hypothetical protein EFT35_07250 [Methanophagales archaeon ANME-1-THS]|nr:MAG: hypothetical protein EFT35_07250 [Methanophagales archaeon ANME-1-THS]